MHKISLLINTLKYMKPEQLLCQLRCRRATNSAIPPLRMVPMRYRPHLFMEELDADPAVAERFLPERILDDELTLLNEGRRVDFDRMSPLEGGASPLWEFNLHYCEYAVALANRAYKTGDRRYVDKVRQIFMGAARDFEKKGAGRSPYVLSLQVVNLLIARDRMRAVKNGVELREEYFLQADLYRKYLFLKKHQDKHLLANHYLENLKAVLILALCFDEPEVVREYLSKLKAELDEQILPDGMHYERSFMYHKLILEDLLRVVMASRSTPWEEEVKAALQPYIRRMSIVTDRMETGIPRTPLFNDSADNVAKPAACLLRGAVGLGLVDPSSDLAPKDAGPGEGYAFHHAGYYRMNRPGYSLLVGAAGVGPAYNPGHNHNDCLSFELFAGEEPVLVNSGCDSYFGVLRGYARSVGAHNTFMIDGTEHSECWASHRVARRLSNVRMTMDSDGFTGQFTDYLGHTGTRRIVYQGRRMTVSDSCPDEGSHEITSYLHIGPAFDVKKAAEGRFLVDGGRDRRAFSILVEEGEADLFPKSQERPYSPEFGQRLPVDILVIRGPRVKYSVNVGEYNK